MFSFRPTIQIEGSWIIGLTSLDAYNYIFNITEENNKFELYRDNFDEMATLTNVVEEIFGYSDISSDEIKDHTLGPVIISIYKKIQLKKSSTDGYTIFLTAYAASTIRDFESYLRTTRELIKDDIQIILEQSMSKFVRYETLPGNYSVKENSEIVHTKVDRPGNLQLEFDDINMKTKLHVKGFGELLEISKFIEKSLSFVFSSFTAYWEYKHSHTAHVDFLVVYTSEKIKKLCTIDKIHSKYDFIDVCDKIHLICDVFDGSIVNGIRHRVFSILSQTNQPDIKYFVNLIQIVIIKRSLF